ncbi:MAG: Gfo/Idh/MocA family oxidoreductase [Coriobacteriia bacterium]
MSANDVRLGVVGYGYWGPNLVRNVAQAQGAELVAVCDAKEENRARFAKVYPNVPVESDLDDFFGRHEMDAVVVATPVVTHYDIALRVIEEGLHCFVEKPLAHDSASARRLVEAAAERGRVLMVGHLMEYHSAVEWIREYVSAPTSGIGDILYLYSQRLNLGKVRREENSLWSLAPHDVSVALYLLGEVPESVSATGADYLQDGIEDVAFATLHFPSGRLANFHVSWLDPHKVRRFTLVGSEKMLVFDDMQATEKVWVYDKGVVPKEALSYGEDVDLRFGDITVPFIEMREPLAKEVSHFVECCKTGKAPRSDGLDGLRVVRVLEAADESIKAGGAPVPLDLEG